MDHEGVIINGIADYCGRFVNRPCTKTQDIGKGADIRPNINANEKGLLLQSLKILSDEFDCENLLACDFEINEAVGIDGKRCAVKLFKSYELNFAPLLA